MLATYLRFIKDKRSSLLGFMAGTIAFLEMYVALFPTFGKLADEKMMTLLDSYPKEIWTVMGVDPAKLSFTKIESFLAMEQFSIIWPILIVILSISLANSAFAAEIEKGTIEVLLAQPLSRLRLFLSRFLAGASLLTVFIFATSYAVLPLAAIHNIDMKAANIFPMAISGLLFALFVYALATLFSTVFSEKGKATFLTTGIIMVSYIANVASGLNKDIADIKYGSIFYYYNSTINFVDGKLVDKAPIFFLVGALIFMIAAAIRFQTRDIAT